MCGGRGGGGGVKVLKAWKRYKHPMIMCLKMESVDGIFNGKCPKHVCYLKLLSSVIVCAID